jgi:hypothetical protein
MSKIVCLTIALLIVASLAQSGVTPNPLIPTPVNGTTGNAPTFNDVFPKIDAYLRNTYWYFLRSADNIYQANANTN